MKSEKKKRKSSLELEIKKAELECANEENENLDNTLAQNARIMYYNQTKSDLNKIITETENPIKALDKSLVFTQEVMNSKNCELIVYAPPCGEIIHKPDPFGYIMREDTNLDMLLFDIRSSFGVKDRRGLKNMRKQTILMCIEGKEPIRINNTHLPREYIKNQRILFESMVKSICPKTTELGEKEFYLLMKKITSDLYKHYNKKHVGFGGVFSEIRKNTVPAIIENIDFKVKFSEGISYYTCPIKTKDEKGNINVIGNVHINFNRPITNEECAFAYDLITSLYGPIRLFRQSNMDDKGTGLYNRNYMIKLMKKGLTTSKKSSCMLVDIDKFKEINDNYGHPVGDKVIYEVLNVFNSLEGDEGLYSMGRYGGDEFILYKDGELVTTARTIWDKMEKLDIRAENIKTNKKEKIEVTLSGGISYSGNGNTDPYILIDEADKALYQAKRKGRHNIICAN